MVWCRVNFRNVDGNFGVTLEDVEEFIEFMREKSKEVVEDGVS